VKYLWGIPRWKRKMAFKHIKKGQKFAFWCNTRKLETAYKIITGDGSRIG
jgi:hypothetical protein